MDWTDSAYVATENNGQTVGFSVILSIQQTISDFLNLLSLIKPKRGKGYGKKY